MKPFTQNSALNNIVRLHLELIYCSISQWNIAVPVKDYGNHAKKLYSNLVSSKNLKVNPMINVTMAKASEPIRKLKKKWHNLADIGRISKKTNCKREERER